MHHPMRMLASALLCALVAGLCLLAMNNRREVVIPIPAEPHKRKPFFPWRHGAAEAKAGRVSPDGKVEPDCDLPNEQQKKNIASKGLGCCVFRSMDHAGHWQNIPVLVGFPEWMVTKGIEGGGDPGKVDKLIEQICKDRNLPKPNYLNVQGADLELLASALQTGRMPCITYSKSPTGRYSGGTIAHMVNLAAGHPEANGGAGWWAVLDNNYIGQENLEWMTTAELKTVKPNWAVIFLDPPPPALPKNLP